MSRLVFTRIDTYLRALAQQGAWHYGRGFTRAGACQQQIDNQWLIPGVLSAGLDTPG